jgi:hypothetical protein
MRIHPISLALRRLKGQRSIHGRVMFETKEEAVASLNHLTGVDFGTDAKKWGQWLRRNRWVYYTSPRRSRNTK